MSQMSAQKIVGITGNIASGKSTLTKYLIDKGYHVIDTDIITKDVYNSNTYFKDELVKLLGKDIIVDNKIDKTKVSSIVFGDKSKLEKLNKLIHPIIFDKTNKEIELSIENIVFVDVPLLFEVGFDKLTNYNIVVSIDLEKQIERLINRNNFIREEALARINAQMPQAQKIDLADYEVSNNGSREDLYEQVDKVIEKIKDIKE
ncbi:MAG: dephospho-CoA kinase [Erysipelotrichales bacterium]